MTPDVDRVAAPAMSGASESVVPDAQSATTEGDPRAPSAFWPAAVLGVVLVGAKGVHWGWPPASWPHLRWWLRDWAISAHDDVLFVLALGILAQIGLVLAGPWPRIRRWVFRTTVATGGALAFCAVIAAGVFHYLRSPLTYPLLYLASSLTNMRSSVHSVATAGIYAALVWVPVAYVAVVLRLSRPRQSLPSRGRVAVLLVGTLGLAGCMLGARQAMTAHWLGRADALIVRSPHWAFIESVIAMLRGVEAPSLEQDFPESDLDDFRPAEDGVPAPYPDPPRNVLVLILEAHSTRYLGLYGSSYPTTPELDAAAQNALVFDSFYTSVGLTANVLVALNLSIYPFMTWREYTVEHPDYPGRTLAQVLSALGHRTVFMQTSYLEYSNQRTFLANRGFDAVLDWNTLSRGEPPVTSWGGDDRLLVDRLLEWIDADRERPFYAMAWTLNTHHPYEPVPGQEIIDFFEGLSPEQRPPDDWDLGRYLNTVRETDRQVGRLFQGLRDRGLADDTLVVIAGDHGQAFGHPHPTWGHGFRLYEENVHVPLVIWSPRLFSAGKRLDTVGSHVDINPTITHILGLPPDPSWHGRSLLDPEQPPRAYFYAANDLYLLGVREGQWKYVYNATHGTEELYDVSVDPDELANVADHHPDRCRRLRQRLAAWRHFAESELRTATSSQR